jgi:hypothetical protein
MRLEINGIRERAERGIRLSKILAKVVAKKADER